MLKKKLGIESVERNWSVSAGYLIDYYKIPSSLVIPEGCEKVGDIIVRS